MVSVAAASGACTEAPQLQPMTGGSLPLPAVHGGQVSAQWSMGAQVGRGCSAASLQVRAASVANHDDNLNFFNESDRASAGVAPGSQ